MTIAAQDLRELLNYDRETGVFTRAVDVIGGKGGVVFKAGTVAGGTDKDGYSVIKIKGKLYKAHRLAWLYVTGSWPRHEMDHINGVKDDNRFVNLRESTRAGNNRNKGARADSVTGVKGVQWDRHAKRFRAAIRVNGKSIYLGRFRDCDAARAAYHEASKKYHGEFARAE